MVDPVRAANKTQVFDANCLATGAETDHVGYRQRCEYTIVKGLVGDNAYEEARHVVEINHSESRPIGGRRVLYSAFHDTAWT
jgi:hypothetical protein